MARTLREVIEEQHFGDGEWAERHVDADGFDIFDDDYVNLDDLLDVDLDELRDWVGLGRAVLAERLYPTKDLALKNPNLMFARGANWRLETIKQWAGVTNGRPDPA